MIDFKEEIQKYLPVLGSDEVDKTVDTGANSNEARDILGLLQEIAERLNADKG